ncbi:hypothetical protein [Paenarthrobacter aurescens]|uniref:hypothetical protein n=1 Tax=Paenarthrobacter aurescens TaxID=43663 RepID=UPI0021BFDA57|nr:hypothetical protein [Paenarthrobacter aurescens]MCT9870844.1 hypothetical protein [Paenarthrobacter aurescens]
MDDANKVLAQTSTGLQVSSNLMKPSMITTLEAKALPSTESDGMTPSVSTVKLSTTGQAQLLVSSGNEQKRPDRKITASFAHGEPTISGDTAVYQTDDKNKKLYVRSTPSGADIFVALGSAKSGQSVSFDYDLPQGTTVSDGLPGFKNFYTPEGDYLGSMKLGTAKDSAGNESPTTLDIKAGKVTQKVSPSGTAIYPLVMAAPSWVYNFEFPLGTGSTVAPFNLLRTCFNCYFPINGATKTYPYVGQVLNLKILIAGGIAVPAPVKIGYSGSTYFQFTALAGHFDGEGSIINFGSVPTPGNGRALNVNAAIVIDRGALNAGNQLAAHGQWSTFASNMCLGLWKQNAASCNWPALYPPV